LTSPTYGTTPVRSLSLEQIEEELTRTERSLATFRDALRKSQAESASDAAALREMGARAKQIRSRPKSWSGGPKRSDAAELEALTAQMQSRSEGMNRTVEAIKAKSAEARELDKRQQALSTRRAELLNQPG
jgi:chromosome segregation ATPase